MRVPFKYYACYAIVVLGGSWAVINGVISKVTIHIRGLITPLITTHEPPNRPQNSIESMAALML